MPGVLKTAMERAVCAVMFLSGLRRSEIAALKPEDLVWHRDDPKIKVRRSWQEFDHKERVLGPTKGKKERVAPFDTVLQVAVKKLWGKTGGTILFSAKKTGASSGRCGYTAISRNG